MNNKSREKTFRFKQFALSNSLAAMKVGTDGVLLGAWADATGVSEVLDVGAGTGLISLMLAQRYPSLKVTALEIDTAAAGEAALNVESSPWPDRIDVICNDFSCFDSTRRYGLIVSNPPFFVDALQAPESRRSIARHAAALSYIALIDRAPRLLLRSGRLAMILPVEFEDDVCFRAALSGMSVVRLVRVFTKPTASSPRRILIELVNESGPNCLPQTLVVNSYEYISLTQEFYLDK